MDESCKRTDQTPVIEDADDRDHWSDLVEAEKCLYGVKSKKKEIILLVNFLDISMSSYLKSYIIMYYL